MAFRFKSKEIVSPKLIVSLEIELESSSLTEQEAADRLQYLIDNSYSEAVSNFIVFLLRETKSSMWELRSIRVKAEDAETK